MKNSRFSKIISDRHAFICQNNNFLMVKTRLLFAVMLCALCAAAQHPAYRNPVAPEFPIVAWYAMPDSAQSPERYAQMRRAGFNISLSMLSDNSQMARALHAADGSGVKLFVSTPSLRTHTRSTILRFKDNPAVAGWYLADEPNHSAFPALAALMDDVTAYDPDPSHVPYINLFPEFARSQQLGTDSYQTYVADYLRTVRPTMVSYDMYPFLMQPDGSITTRPLFFKNFATISSLAKANGLPFWAFCLATAHQQYPPATKAMLNLEAFAALAWGAQGIQYYTYWQHGSYHHGPIDNNGIPTVTYDIIAELNREIQVLSGIFLNMDVMKVGYEGPSLPSGIQRFGSLPAPFSGNVSAAGNGVIVSWFKGGDLHEYLMIINTDIASSQRISIRFSGKPRVIRADGTTARADSRHVLAPGGHIIYRIR